jgi:hypothetical protein
VLRSKSRARRQSRTTAFFAIGTKRIGVMVLPDHTGQGAFQGRDRQGVGGE